MKYLPGNIFHFAYRHQQTKNESLSHKLLGTAAVYESMILVTAALLISNFLFLWPQQNTWLTAGLPFPIWAVFLMELVVFFFIMKIIIPSVFFRALFSYVVYFSGMGLITYILIYALNFELQPYLFLTACFALSWLAGYVVPGAPGGTGVREVVFIMLCSPMMAEHQSLVIIALIRLLSVFAETSVYFLASHLSQPYRRFASWSDKTMP